MSLRDAATQQALHTAVDAFGNPGVIVMVAGGKSNSDAYHLSPAFVPLAITVGSTTITDSRSTFSLFSSRPICGPRGRTLNLPAIAIHTNCQYIAAVLALPVFN